MIDLSIIVPAYNTERYIKQCLLSLCEQNYDLNKFEIIVVNDDSPDNLESIVIDFTKRYENIKYIRQTNGRQGKARNTGIGVAKGRYITFVDSDDCWLNTETISTFVSLADKYNLDIISSSTYIHFSDNRQPTTDNRQPTTDVKIYDRNEYIGKKIKHFSVWLSFYKNDIVKKTAFREEVFFEDLDYVYRTIWTIGQNGKIGVIDFPFYGYRANPFSTTNKHSIKSFIDNCKANEEVINFCHSCEDMSEECKQNCYDRLRKSLINLLLVSRNYSLNNSNKALKEIDIVTLFRIIDQKANWKQRTIIFTYKIFPFLILLTIRGLVLVKRFITH